MADTTLRSGTGTGTGLSVDELIRRDQQRDTLMRNEGLIASGMLSFVNADAEKGDGGYAAAMAKLAQNPTTRDYTNDSNFCEKIKALWGPDPSDVLRRHANDPRFMAAVMALNGYDLDVTEDDLRKAEKGGHVAPTAAARATDEENIAKTISSAPTARNAGRLFFAEANSRKKTVKQQPRRCLELAAALFKHAAQLARDAKWGVEGDDETTSLDEVGNVGTEGGDPREAPTPAERDAFVATCMSNAAMAFLKLERWKLASDAAREALSSHADDVPAPNAKYTFARDKAHYRLAKACEALSDLDGAADHMAAAASCASAGVEAAAAAVRADMTKSALVRRQPYASAEVKKQVKDADVLKKEAATLAEKRRARDESRRTRAPDAMTAGLRGGGVMLHSASDAKKMEETPRIVEVSDGGGDDDKNGVDQQLASAYSQGVSREVDWSHFLRQLIGKAFDGACHDFGDGAIRVTGVDWHAYDGHASIQEKHGRRSLFYELDVMLDWVAESRRGDDAKMQGKLRLYNVAQDTTYEPGGDPDKCYMYSLGMRPATSAFERAVAENAEELFHVVCERVGVNVISQLVLK